ncbi:glycosyl transferase family 2 [Candidatus Vecturithrix granuli]|uniref:Glycosyl transferase family 2 n=1 Tax=Vecturithrix granuli TaxID=1499967 RepID=A0A081BXU8_VECG1|nr:glycosyl transferase family 2 [Candidatus Vecturithrix granuli]
MKGEPYYSEPVVSVVIPTYGREAMLCATVQAVLDLRYPHFEVIIVDKTLHHESDTERFLSKCAAQGKVRWIQDAQANLPRARNIGVFYAKGELVVFLDDDCTPVPDLLEKYVRHFSDSLVVGVGGRVALNETELTRNYPLPIGIAQAADQWKLLLNRYTTSLPDALRIGGGNSCWRRQTLIALGGFHEDFRANAYGEDVEFVARARKSGGRVGYDPEAAMIHHMETSGGCRMTVEKNFLFARNKARNYYYTVIRAKGYGFAIFEASRRCVSPLFTVLHRRKATQHEHQRPINLPRPGPVSEILVRDQPIFYKVWEVLKLKAPQILASTLGIIEGFGDAWKNRRITGHYLQTSQACQQTRVINPQENRGGYDGRSF